jgi:DNA-binding NarL/FixJ family response regulator
MSFSAKRGTNLAGGTGGSSDSGCISIILITEMAMFGDALRRALETEDGFALSDVSDFEAAVQEVAQQHPDIVVLDADVPLEEFVVRVKRLRGVSADSAIIVLSMAVDQLFVASAISLGINSVLPKVSSTSELTNVIRHVHEHSERAVLSLPRASPDDKRENPDSSLTLRELQILGAAAEGLSNRQIASHFGITEGTVKSHMHSIFSKLRTRSRIEAVNKAIAGSLISSHRRRAWVRR